MERKLLVQELTRLDETAWVDVIEEVYQERRKRPPEVELASNPAYTWEENQARRYARRHMAADPGITKVIFLPAGAPPRELRLLEVNALLTLPDAEDVEPVDFGVDRGGPEGHVLFVADITPRQWEAIRSGDVRLPAGWELRDYQEFSRRQE